MQRVTTSTRAIDLFGTGKDGWKDGNPGLGIAATAFNADWVNSVQEEICNVIEDAGITLDVDDNTQLLDAINARLHNIMHIADHKSSGTDGGSASSGNNKRTLNTVVYNNITGASLASDNITLPAGTYEFDFSSITSDVNLSRAYIYNNTDSSVAIYGLNQNGYGGAEDNMATNNTGRGIITIAASKSLSLYVYCQVARTTIGLGEALSQGTEVYSLVTITKIA